MIEKVFQALQLAFLLATIPAAIIFPVWYHLHMKWYASEMGRHVMAYSTVVALLYISALTRLVFEGELYGTIVRMTLSFLMMIVVWWRLIVFIKIRRRVQREREARQGRAPETGLPGVQPR